MTKSQHFDSSSDPTLAKLLEVDSQLVVRETELLAQLEGVQEKRRSLKTVISLFATTDTHATTPVELPAQTSLSETDSEPETDSKTIVSPQLETKGATTTLALPTEASEVFTKSRTAQTTQSPTKRDKTKKLAPKAKVANKALGWQQYLRTEFRQNSLPEAVYLVLQRRAEQIFEISAVVDAIFGATLPNEVQSRVHRQISNILSDGARQNKWYRGQPGCYSMSRDAVAAHSGELSHANIHPTTQTISMHS